MFSVIGIVIAFFVSIVLACMEVEYWAILPFLISFSFIMIQISRMKTMAEKVWDFSLTFTCFVFCVVFFLESLSQFGITGDSKVGHALIEYANTLFVVIPFTALCGFGIVFFKHGVKQKIVGFILVGIILNCLGLVWFAMSAASTIDQPENNTVHATQMTDEYFQQILRIRQELVDDFIKQYKPSPYASDDEKTLFQERLNDVRKKWIDSLINERNNMQ